VGGIMANLFFPSAVIAGYLVAGVGDAIGEPAGIRFGRHTYKVWSLSSVPAVRSWEGSFAVFLASALVVFVAALVTPAIGTGSSGFLKILAIAAVSALVEAVSPHGWDNLTMQIVPVWLVSLWMT